MTPRIVGIDGGGEPRERLLQALVVGALGVAHPWQLVADVDAFVQAPAHLSRVGDVAGLDGHSELVDQSPVGPVLGAEQLSPGLDGAPVGKLDRLDAAARTVAGFEHNHVRSPPCQVTRCRQAGEPGAEHSHVDQLAHLLLTIPA